MKPVLQPRSLFLVLGLLLALALRLSLALGPVCLPLADPVQAGLRLPGLAMGGAQLEQAVHAEPPQAVRGQRRPESSQPLIAAH